ncbi:hypothetical protein D3C72_1584600 [compost metagenome]
MARRLESVISVLMLADALRVGVSLKVSPWAAPPLNVIENPSITGAGVVVVLKVPIGVLSGRR